MPRNTNEDDIMPTSTKFVLIVLFIVVCALLLIILTGGLSSRRRIAAVSDEVDKLRAETELTQKTSADLVARAKSSNSISRASPRSRRF